MIWLRSAKVLSQFYHGIKNINVEDGAFGAPKALVTLCDTISD
ncbi:hypothetical protein [Ruegeria arenilitoris]|nr:hypothetical protein [Ruegeria arenilitoris]